MKCIQNGEHCHERFPLVLFGHDCFFLCSSDNDEIIPGGDKAKQTQMNYKNVEVPTFGIRGLNGDTLNSKALSGKVVVVDFWATWCQPCIEEIPQYNALYQRFKNENFALIAIAMSSGGPKSLKPFIERFSIRYPIYLADKKVSRNFGSVTALPTTFVIDQSGRIIRRFVGTNQHKIEEIEKIIQKLLKKL